MKILITGANGFIGRNLALRLLKQPIDGREVSSLTLLSRRFTHPPNDRRVHCIKGDIVDPSTLQSALASEPDIIFHLACIPGGAAEADFELGKRINQEGTIWLLELLRLRKWQSKHLPRLVFTSSIGVYGKPWPNVVDENMLARPELSYGSQKLVGEILIADYSRRGWIDGRSVRLPGIVSRPPDETGHASRFLSDIIRELAAGHKYTCPVAPEARSWFLSLPACIDNLIHAAEITGDALNSARQWQMPALHLSMEELVEGIAQVYGEQIRCLISWLPDPVIQDIYGSYPPLLTPGAEKAGFRHDQNVHTLVKRALDTFTFSIPGPARSAD
jgi:nucleoside-diphosphate-sugar epimerase